MFLFFVYKCVFTSLCFKTECLIQLRLLTPEGWKQKALGWSKESQNSILDFLESSQTFGI